MTLMPPPRKAESLRTMCTIKNRHDVFVCGLFVLLSKSTQMQLVLILMHGCHCYTVTRSTRHGRDIVQAGMFNQFKRKTIWLLSQISSTTSCGDSFTLLKFTLIFTLILFYTTIYPHSNAPRILVFWSHSGNLCLLTQTKLINNIY